MAVLMGGLSAERDVSLSTGRDCARGLEEAGYRVTTIDVDRDIATRLREVAPDVCFNALHGRYGEDGCIQGLLETMGIPYTHSGVHASSLAINKELTKLILRDSAIPFAPSRLLTRDEALRTHAMEPPYVIKPVAEGSSVGVVIVEAGANRPPDAIADVLTYNGLVMAEKFVAGRELTCACIGDTATGIIDIRPADGLAFYDYEAKYAPGGSVHILPAEIPDAVTAAIQAATLEAHRALRCRGVTRSDFRYDDATGTLAFLEINTQPGMTPTSLVPEQAAHAGMTFSALVAWMVEDASLDR
ncbi:MAG: D-alanine--D-alanine ligase [Pseudomonadota bacterium]